MTEKEIIELKKQKNNIKERYKNILKCIKIKFIIFYSLLFLILILFWYYIACFCAVYKNTQIHLIKDTLISFCFSLIYPFGLCLIPGIFRIPSLRAKRQNKEYIYRIGNLLQLL